MLGVVAIAASPGVNAGGAGAVGGEEGDGNLVGLADVLVVGVEVGEVGAVVLEEAEVLAGAGEDGATVVGGAHVAAEEGSGGAGAGGGVGDDGFGLDAVGGGVIIFADEEGMRDGVVFEAGDVPEIEGQTGGGLAIGGVEGAILGGVLVGDHVDVKGALDGEDAALDLNFHAIAGASGDGEAVGFGEAEDFVVLGLRGAEFCGELGGREEVTEGGTGGIKDLGEEGLKAGGVSERKNDVEAQHLRCGETPESLCFACHDDVADVVGHDGLGL